MITNIGKENILTYFHCDIDAAQFQYTIESVVAAFQYALFCGKEAVSVSITQCRLGQQNSVSFSW